MSTISNYLNSTESIIRKEALESLELFAAMDLRRLAERMSEHKTVHCSSNGVRAYLYVYTHSLYIHTYIFRLQVCIKLCITIYHNFYKFQQKDLAAVCLLILLIDNNILDI